MSELARWILRVVPGLAGIWIRRVVYRRLMKGAGRITVAENVVIRGFRNISLGDGVVVMVSSYVYADHGYCTIGDRTAINNNVQLSANHGTINIGCNVLIGPNVVLRAADHVFDSRDIPIRDQGHRGGVITLEDDVWLGANVVVLRDVRIGRGAVVGAGAVVTSDIPPYAVAVGVPARVIRIRN
jgi:galactoside O-acetyltransferase